MTRMPGKKPVTRNTATGGLLLENSVNHMHALNFQVYDSLDRFRRAVIIPDRYVIRNYPQQTIYNTRGKKEAYIVSASPTVDFSPDHDGMTRVLVEAKHQRTSGSVDEKIPFVWASFLESDVPNWVLIMDGPYWKTTRGLAVVAWAMKQVAPQGKTWHVTNAKGFVLLTTRNWGTPVTPRRG
jgi:PD-(D/E)XK nuclease superfamily protein